MQRIVGANSLTIFWRTVVGIGSRLQCELGDLESKSAISNRMAGENGEVQAKELMVRNEQE